MRTRQEYGKALESSYPIPPTYPMGPIINIWNTNSSAWFYIILILWSHFHGGFFLDPGVHQLLLLYKNE